MRIRILPTTGGKRSRPCRFSSPLSRGGIPPAPSPFRGLLCRFLFLPEVGCLGNILAGQACGRGVDRQPQRTREKHAQPTDKPRKATRRPTGTELGQRRPLDTLPETVVITLQRHREARIELWDHGPRGVIPRYTLHAKSETNGAGTCFRDTSVGRVGKPRDALSHSPNNFGHGFTRLFTVIHGSPWL